MGIRKNSLLNDYYFDEFLAVLDEYNDMHSVDSTSNAASDVREVDASEW